MATLAADGAIQSIDLLHQGEEAYVLSLCTDSTGAIWVGYRNGEIRKVTPLSDNSWQFSTNLHVLPAQIQGEIMALCADDEQLWIGTSTGLGCYDLTHQACRSFVNEPNNSQTLIQNYVKGKVSEFFSS